MKQKYKHISSGAIVYAEQQTEDNREPEKKNGKDNPRYGAQMINHGSLSVPKGYWKLWNASGGIISDQAPSDAAFKADYELVDEASEKPEKKPKE